MTTTKYGPGDYGTAAFVILMAAVTVFMVLA